MEELVDLWGREGWNKNPKCAAIRLGRAVTLAPTKPPHILFFVPTLSAPQIDNFLAGRKGRGMGSRERERERRKVVRKLRVT
mmetsp:Transcript_12132/g.33638  ORF Transcript_12132/g.33638 Transcript_12132/m.33638 type:complete len:82 (+) Transcript_12132:1026-1271(+)